MLDRCRIVAVGGHEYRAPNFCGKARWQNTKLCETRMAHLFQKKHQKVLATSSCGGIPFSQINMETIPVNVYNCRWTFFESSLK